MTQSSSQFNLDNDDAFSFSDMLAHAAEHEEEGEDTSMYFSSSPSPYGEGSHTVESKQSMPVVTNDIQNDGSPSFYDDSQLEPDSADSHVKTVKTNQYVDTETNNNHIDATENLTAPSSVTPIVNEDVFPISVISKNDADYYQVEKNETNETVTENKQEFISAPPSAPHYVSQPLHVNTSRNNVHNDTAIDHKEEQQETAVTPVAPTPIHVDSQEKPLTNHELVNNHSSIVSSDELVNTVDVVLNVVNAYRNIPESMRASVAEFICRTGDVDVADESRIIVDAIRTDEAERAAVMNLHDMLLEKDLVERILAIMSLDTEPLHLLGNLTAIMSNEELPETNNNIEFTRKVGKMIEKIPSETIDHIQHTNKVLAAAAYRS